MKKLMLMLCVLMILCGCSSNSGSGGNEQQEDHKYKIGVLQLVQHAALDSATSGFIDEVKKQLGEDKVEIIVENAAGDTANCSIIANGFIQDGVDLILANATPALQAAASATGDIPILGTSVTEYGVALGIDNFSGTTGINVSGTSDLAPLEDQAQMILDLFPETKSVGIIYCSSEANSIYQVKVVKDYLVSKDIEVKEATFTDSNDIALVARDLCETVDVIYTPTDNMVASCSETLAGIVVPAKKPVITGDEGTCAAAGVATLAIDYYELGAETGRMAVEILTGKANVGDMEIRYYTDPIKEYNAEIAAELSIKIPQDYVKIGQ